MVRLGWGFSLKFHPYGELSSIFYLILGSVLAIQCSNAKESLTLWRFLREQLWRAIVIDYTLGLGRSRKLFLTIPSKSDATVIRFLEDRHVVREKANFVSREVEQSYTDSISFQVVLTSSADYTGPVERGRSSWIPETSMNVIECMFFNFEWWPWCLEAAKKAFTWLKPVSSLGIGNELSVAQFIVISFSESHQTSSSPLREWAFWPLSRYKRHQ